MRELGSAYSERFIDRVKTKPGHFSDFAELEISTLYQRGFNGTNSSFLSAQRHSETISPFCDVDFFEYCLSIPLKSRVNHKIYKKWILKKYPKAAEYVWDNTKQKFSKKTIYVRVGEKRVPINQIHSSILRKLGLKKKPSQTRHNMNPFDYWYSLNGCMKEFSDKYLSENLPRLNAFPELKDVCRELYHSGSASEKYQALTLLSAAKSFCFT